MTSSGDEFSMNIDHSPELQILEITSLNALDGREGKVNGKSQKVSSNTSAMLLTLPSCCNTYHQQVGFFTGIKSTLVILKR